MPEPFKNLLNPALVREMGACLELAGGGDFSRRGFEEVALRGLGELELKERSNRILEGLEAGLPGEFEKACAILVSALGPAGVSEDLDFAICENGIAGWAVMPMADYVARHGLDFFEESLAALREMTMRYTSEFAIRPFLVNRPVETMAVMQEWARDENLHVRRLASEGSRPRLPWGIRLQEFDRDPTAVLALLEMLKDDSAEYVRRSVANSLNDIAKSHPDRVAKVARRWLRGASMERRRLVRHACRTLIKDGHGETLAAFGYGEPEVEVAGLCLEVAAIRVGESLPVKLELRSTGRREQSIMLDYAIHFVRAGGKHSRKVFKWKSFVLGAGEGVTLQKKHSFRRVTTRVYYPGAHAIEVLVNGKSLGEAEFELIDEGCR